MAEAAVVSVGMAVVLLPVLTTKVEVLTRCASGKTDKVRRKRPHVVPGSVLDTAPEEVPIVTVLVLVVCVATTGEDSVVKTAVEEAATVSVVVLCCVLEVLVLQTKRNQFRALRAQVCNDPRQEVKV